MPVRTSYPQGTPSWVDLQTTDAAAAKAFYAGLLGWEYDDQPMPENGEYSRARLPGRDGFVAAIAGQPPALAAAGVAPAWNTYLAVDSADEAAQRAVAAGGMLGMEPFDVPGGAGRMAFVLDPGGAAVGLWQAGTHLGADLVNEPGAVLWNELITADPSVTGFYRQVAGLTARTMAFGDGQYTCFEAAGRQVGGIVQPPITGVPSHWHVYFAVDGTDAAADRATSLGGAVIAPPFDTPVGRVATITDPQGATFSVIEPAGEPS
jgi:uncharacterized protein